MDIKKIQSEIVSYASLVGASYINIYLAVLIALIVIFKLWYGYKLKDTAIEDTQEYYQNGKLKKISKKFRL